MTTTSRDLAASNEEVPLHLLVEENIVVETEIADVLHTVYDIGNDTFVLDLDRSALLTFDANQMIRYLAKEISVLVNLIAQEYERAGASINPHVFERSHLPKFEADPSEEIAQYHIPGLRCRVVKLPDGSYHVVQSYEQRPEYVIQPNHDCRGIMRYLGHVGYGQNYNYQRAKSLCSK